MGLVLLWKNLDDLRLEARRRLTAMKKSILSTDILSRNLLFTKWGILYRTARTSNSSYSTS